jgi:nucleoside-diphosphate-sugar epimerase
MIIGGGLLGNGFVTSKHDYQHFVVFASGVSNSREIKAADFVREKELIIKTIRDHKKLTFIYFSSILAGVCDNPYYNHKLAMEALIKKETDHYRIFRIPQVVGGSGNKNTLFNYFKNSINQNEAITVYKDVQRSLIDIDDLIHIIHYCKDATDDKLIYIAAIEKIDVLDIVNKIGAKLNKTPIIKLQTAPDNNNWSHENSGIVEQAIAFLGIQKTGYTDRIIEKYIS